MIPFLNSRDAGLGPRGNKDTLPRIVPFAPTLSMPQLSGADRVTLPVKPIIAVFDRAGFLVAVVRHILCRTVPGKGRRMSRRGPFLAMTAAGTAVRPCRSVKMGDLQEVCLMFRA